MTTSLQQLGELLNAPREVESLEFKRATNQYDNTKVFKYCVAIGNEGGGKLICGVTDTLPRQVVGTRSSTIRLGFSGKSWTS